MTELTELYRIPLSRFTAESQRCREGIGLSATSSASPRLAVGYVELVAIERFMGFAGKRLGIGLGVAILRQLSDSELNPGSSSLRVRLVLTVFFAMTPALLCLYFTRLFWVGFVAAALALVGAWFAIERFVLRPLRTLTAVIDQLRVGNRVKVSVHHTDLDEIGRLALALDQWADASERRRTERERERDRSLERALQQTAVGAIGQFALTSSDFAALFTQAATLISQTLQVEFCRVLELLPEGKSMLLRAGVGWKKGIIGVAVIDAESGSQAGFTLQSGEPVVILDLRKEKRFTSDPLLEEHHVVSGASVAIAARGKNYGVLAVYSTRPRQFDSEDLQFLLSAANALAIAVEHRRAEAELKKLADFAQLNPNPALELNAEAIVTYSNKAAIRLAEAVGREHPSEILPLDIRKLVHSCLTTGRSKTQLESLLEGHVLSWSFHPVVANQVVHCYVADITDRLSLEAQLRQSQKMESVGQLAAGVAHDFNNMLTVIEGHASMLMTRSNLAPEFRESAHQISFAAERAAALTRQLLMFSRKSVMQRRPTDLREVVGDTSKMLKRLLGEPVVLDFRPSARVPLVDADTAMVEQVLMNLAVNARDAMALGGRLSIEVDPVVITTDYVMTHPEARVGAYVRLRVSDTGHGMNAKTMARIFEPFFTTKGPGRGTGLGLATVYGIVRQHEGWVEVTSEVGKGTTFAVFFPARTETSSAERKPDPLLTPVRGGNETILVVEDEVTVRSMGKIILQDCGYQVFEAASGVDAIGLWEQHHESIQLLLTDMVMPEGLSGVELAQQLRAHRPELKVLFTSGYCVDEFFTDFFKSEGHNFLQKPYTRSTLAKAVRDVLDSNA